MKNRDVQYYFVDESGDATFYNKRGNLIVNQNGCSPILILGYLTTSNPRALRTKLKELHTKIIQDEFYHEIPSFQKTQRAFHAKDDVPEIRKQVYDLLSTMNFEAGFIVARKIEKIFIKQHQKNCNLFYFDIVSNLFRDIFNIHEKNIIHFSKKDTKIKQKLFENAVNLAQTAFEKDFGTSVKDKTDVFIQTPTDETCLQIIDYVNWAVYRAFVHREMRYYNLIKHKVIQIWDLYGDAEDNVYDLDNPLNLEKIASIKKETLYS